MMYIHVFKLKHYVVKKIIYVELYTDYWEYLQYILQILFYS